MTNIEYFRFLDNASKTRALNDVESHALERLLRLKEVRDYMDERRQAK